MSTSCSRSCSTASTTMMRLFFLVPVDPCARDPPLSIGRSLLLRFPGFCSSLHLNIVTIPFSTHGLGWGPKVRGGRLTCYHPKIWDFALTGGGQGWLARRVCGHRHYQEGGPGPVHRFGMCVCVWVRVCGCVWLGCAYAKVAVRFCLSAPVASRLKRTVCLCHRCSHHTHTCIRLFTLIRTHMNIHARTHPGPADDQGGGTGLPGPPHRRAARLLLAKGCVCCCGCCAVLGIRTDMQTANFVTARAKFSSLPKAAALLALDSLAKRSYRVRPVNLPLLPFHGCDVRHRKGRPTHGGKNLSPRGPD